MHSRTSLVSAQTECCLVDQRINSDLKYPHVFLPPVLVARLMPSRLTDVNCVEGNWIHSLKKFLTQKKLDSSCDSSQCGQLNFTGNHLASKQSTDLFLSFF